MQTFTPLGRFLRPVLVAAALVVLFNSRTPARVTSEYLAYFNVPLPTGGAIVKNFPDYTIHNMLLKYINGAAPGSEIRGHITNLDDCDREESDCENKEHHKADIVAALIEANRRRGVAVYLVHDGQDQGSLLGDTLEDHFGTRHKYCAEFFFNTPPFVHVPIYYMVTSCVSKVRGATHHLKNWFFSNTEVDGRTRTYSTWVTSYNLTSLSDRQFNDLFIVNDNYDLYSAGVESFRSFYHQTRTNDLFNVPGRGHHIIRSANAEMSFSPQAASSSSTLEHPTDDQVAMALSRIDKRERGCALKVANLSISSSRKKIIHQLGRIRALGCSVQVAFTEFHNDALPMLWNRGISPRIATGTAIHSKMMIYRGSYNGLSNTRLVWGGSHNWTVASLTVRDEVFVGISHAGLYNSYKDYFEKVWARARTLRRPRPEQSPEPQ